MEQSLKSAIYYLSDNSTKYNIITEFSYDGTRESFGKIIDTFRSNIQIRGIFGNRENICYEIADSLHTHYNVLLLNQLDTILIVTRYDDVIKISQIHEENPKDHHKINGQKINNRNIGIVKIDSVVAELNIDNIHNARKGRWYKYPLVLGGILVLLTLGLSGYTKDFDR